MEPIVNNEAAENEILQLQGQEDLQQAYPTNYETEQEDGTEEEIDSSQEGQEEYEQPLNFANVVNLFNNGEQPTAPNQTTNKEKKSDFNIDDNVPKWNNQQEPKVETAQAPKQAATPKGKKKPGKSKNVFTSEFLLRTLDIYGAKGLAYLTGKKEEDFRLTEPEHEYIKEPLTDCLDAYVPDNVTISPVMALIVALLLVYGGKFLMSESVEMAQTLNNPNPPEEPKTQERPFVAHMSDELFSGVEQPEPPVQVAKKKGKGRPPGAKNKKQAA